MHFSCNLCGFKETTTEMADAWDALFHEHDVDELRRRYGDEMADIYLETLERQRPDYMPNPYRSEVS